MVVKVVAAAAVAASSTGLLAEAATMGAVDKCSAAAKGARAALSVAVGAAVSAAVAEASAAMKAASATVDGASAAVEGTSTAVDKASAATTEAPAAVGAAGEALASVVVAPGVEQRSASITTVQFLCCAVHAHLLCQSRQHCCFVMTTLTAGVSATPAASALGSQHASQCHRQPLKCSTLHQWQQLYLYVRK